MKFPKLLDGPSPPGETKARELYRTSSPFLTAMGKDWISRKKGEYSEVLQLRASVGTWLWGIYNTDDDVLNQYVPVLRANPDNQKNSVKQKLSVLYTFLPGPYTPAQPFAAFVGDGYVAHVATNEYAWDAGSPMWISLTKAGSKDREYLVSEITPELKNKSISYIDQFAVAGQVHQFVPIPTGWVDEDIRYRWAAVVCGSTDRTAYMMSTAEIAPVDVDILAQLSPLTDILSSGTFCAGPGKLLSFAFAQDESGFPVVLRYPAMLKSDDHGATWSWEELTFMYANLYNGVGFNWQSAASNYMTVQCSITYIGDDKTFFVVPNAYVSGTPGGDARFAPRLYIATDGTGWANVPWPADSWECGPNFGFEILDADTPRIAGLANRSLRFAHLSFGVGCFYMPVKYPEGWKIMSTRDFGASWTFSDFVPSVIVPPDAYSVPGGNIPPSNADGFAATVVKPYVDDEEPGEIIFAGTDAAAGTIRFFRTDGLFEEFNELRPVRSATALEIEIDYPGFFFVYTGGVRGRAPIVHPGFPGLFDEPSA